MAELDPYEVLRIPHDADTAAIEDAYDKLFDRYEKQAEGGDRAAMAKLESLNEARDTLVDPAQRVALDARLAAGRKSQTGAPASSRSSIAAGAATQTHRETKSVAPSQRQPAYRMPPRARGRGPSRPIVQPRGFSLPILPILVVGVLAVALAVALYFLLAKVQGTTTSVGVPETGEGAVVATVNGAPIYTREYEERVQRDKAAALADPFSASLINNFQGITGTRMLNILKSDSLDKLINLEVIVQQAKKEGVYPTEPQQASLVEKAKVSDIPQGQSFVDFLKKKNITEGQYKRAVVSNVVYTVMANDHMPAAGTTDERTNGFIKWICDTRKQYDVKILLNFNVQNPACTSGLPVPEVPLPGLDQSQPAPQAQPTSAAPIAPGATTAPTKP